MRGGSADGGSLASAPFSLPSAYNRKGAFLLPQMYTWRGKTCALGLSAVLALSYAPFAFADVEDAEGDQQQEVNLVSDEIGAPTVEQDMISDGVKDDSAVSEVDGEELNGVVESPTTEEGNAETESSSQIDQSPEDGSVSLLSEENDQSGIIASGVIGDDGTWSVTADGVLTIGGNGVLFQDYKYPYQDAVSPEKFPNGITVVVEEGVTGFAEVYFAFSGMTADVNEMVLPSSFTSLDVYATFGNVKKFSGESPLIKDGFLYSDTSYTHLIAMPRNGTEYRIPEGVVTFGAQYSLPDEVDYLYIPASLEDIEIKGSPVVKRVECDPGNSVYRVDTDPASSTYGSLITIEPNRWGGYDFGVKATIEKYVDPDTNVVYTSDGKQLLSAAGAKGDVAILDGCEYIAASAFSGCTELASVSIPSSVQIIGNYAFSGCTALTLVSLSDGLTSIGDGAFNGCSSLASVDIPDSVTSIGKVAFNGTALGSFTAPGKLWEGTDSTQHTQDPMNPDTLFVSGTPVTIGTPDWKDENGNPKPYAESIKTVNLANYEASYIPAYMFMGLTGLESVTIPSTVRNIMSGAFFGCEKLTDVYVLGTNTSIQGFGTAGSEVSDFDIDLYPAFGHNVWNGQDWEAQALSLNLYGLAYGDNPIISYAAENNSTFIPFVVLETGVDSSEELFGFPVTGYNNVKIADMVYTGEELTPQITVSFTDKANGGVADRVLEAGVDCRVTYKDEGGNTVSSIVAPGTYTAQIIGNDDRGVIGTQNVEFRVIDPDQEQVVDPGQQGGQQTTDPGQQQAPSQQAGYQPGGSMGQVQQNAALPQTGDTVDVMPFAAVATAAGLVAAGAATVHARRKKDTE